MLLKKQMYYYSLPLYGHSFKGKVYDMAQLGAKFQIWCRQFGISDEESLSLWLVNSPLSEPFARKAARKLPESRATINLTNIQ